MQNSNVADDSFDTKNLFQMLSGAAMNPKKYVKKTLPESVTVYLRPDTMEIINVISARIGASRSNVARYIIESGLYEAASGCGFSIDEKGNIPDKEKGSWDLTPRLQGFSHSPSEDKE